MEDEDEDAEVEGEEEDEEEQVEDEDEDTFGDSVSTCGRPERDTDRKSFSESDGE